MPQPDRQDSTPSLRRVWTTMLVEFLAVLVAVVIIAAVAGQHERSNFAETTDELETATVALIDLDRAVLESTGELLGFVYRGGTPEQREAAEAAYAEGRIELNEAFDSTATALHSAEERALLERARRTWLGIDAAVLGAAEAYTDAELFARLAAGDDPFIETVWSPYDELDRQLADLRAASVVALRDQVAATDRQAWLVGAGLAAALVLALGIGYFAARRMSDRVLRPLVALRARAEAMGSGSLAEPVGAAPHAVTEIRDLERTFRRTAAELHRSHVQLHAQAHTDALTGLANRKMFSERLDELLDDPAAERVAVLFVDLDDFKDVNDAMGHAAGDELLEIVARRLRAATRGCEIVARLGGDEFAVAMVVDHSADAATAVANRILTVLDQPVTVAGAEIAVQGSIGVAISDAGATATDADDLLGRSDFSMYMAKSQGKGRYELHSALVHTEMAARMELRNDLRGARVREELVLHYQPIIALADERVVGFEALIRWNHPTRGILPPSEFIELAEDTGAIVDIGAWVIDRACAVLAQLHRRDPSLFMSVNVSPRQLVDRDLTAVVVEALERHRIVPDRLVLEVTEATAMTNTEAGAGVLGELRGHGLHVALDDFGTGFSSLRYLGDLPADIIKIDRSFVVGRGAVPESMLRSIVDLAQRLGLDVIAEGIEGPEQLDRLRAFAGIAGQGFVFARPMPESEVGRYCWDRSPVPPTPATR